jgi:hypothetical protein
MTLLVELNSNWILLGLIANARPTLLCILLRLLLSARSAHLSASTGVVDSVTIRHRMMASHINTVLQAVVAAMGVAASTGVVLAVVASHLAVEGAATTVTLVYAKENH